MAEGVELATAYVTIIPSLKGATRQIERQLGGVDTSKAGSTIGKRLGGSIGKSMLTGQVGRRVAATLVRAHRLHQVGAHQFGRLVQTAGKLVQVEFLGGEDALLRAVIAQMAHEGARINALQSNNALLGQVVTHRDAVTPVRGSAAQVVHNHAAQRRTRGRPTVCDRPQGTLRVGRVDAVVANLRIGHGNNLACIGGVGKHLKVAFERGVEAYLAGHRARSAASTAVKHRAVGKHEDGGPGRSFARGGKHALCKRA